MQHLGGLSGWGILIVYDIGVAPFPILWYSKLELLPFSWSLGFEEGSFDGEDPYYKGARFSHGSTWSYNIKDTWITLVGSLETNVGPIGSSIMLLSIPYLIYSFWVLDHHIFLVYNLLLQHYGLIIYLAEISLSIGANFYLFMQNTDLDEAYNNPSIK